jgi:hypothetical protein
MVTAEIIAKCALDHYQYQLPPQKGKPRLGLEWTVYAAIVASWIASDDDDKASDGSEASCSCWVVSCATGTKCTAVRRHGRILHDGHAEVLARRGLVRVLQNEIICYNNSNTNNGATTENDNKGVLSSQSLLEIMSHDTSISGGANTAILPQFRLRKNLRLDLYISDSPCGDASIYCVQEGENGTGDNNEGKNNDIGHPGPPRDADSILYTGAKIIVSESTGVTAAYCGGQQQLLTVHQTSKQEEEKKSNHDTKGNNNNNHHSVVAREKVQLLGKLRTKSGRSNLPDHLRSSSMSCSDKIVQWSILGLQGGMLSQWIPIPIRLTSIVVSRDPRVAVAVAPRPLQIERTLTSPTDPSTTTGGATTEQCKEESRQAAEYNTSMTQQQQNNEDDNDNNNAIQDSQVEALRRAIPNRVNAVHLYLKDNNTLQSLSFQDPHPCGWNTDGLEGVVVPWVRVVPLIFPCGKAATTIARPAICMPMSSVRPEAAPGHGVGTLNSQETISEKVSARKRKRNTTDDKADSFTTVSPCGFSLNWQQEREHDPSQLPGSTTKDRGKGNLPVELLIGARGVCQGKKPKSETDYKQLASRLCRWKLTQTTLKLLASSLCGKDAARDATEEDGKKFGNPDVTNKEAATTYQELKRQCSSQDWKVMRRAMRSGGPLAGWLTNQEGDDFSLDPK